MSNSPKVLSVTSGKGGVGKTNFSANLACCLARAGQRVVLLDADLGLANVDVILGVNPPHNIFDLFKENIQLKDVLFETPYGFKILPASSGTSNMMTLETGQKLELLEIVDELEDELDIMIVDTGAGIHDNVLYFNLAVQERIIMLTTEPTSLTDAYALIKVLKQRHGIERFKVVINMAPSEEVANDIFKRLYSACDHFLEGIYLDFLGTILRDPTVRQSVMEQTPFCIKNPHSNVAKSVENIAKLVQNWETPEKVDGNIKFFWKKLLFGA